jgi:threonine/homoserine/homoserine lactone efflux protein
MGIAAAHALWCLAVASQLEVAADWLTAHGQWLRAGLGGLLCWLGGRAWTCGRSADAGLTDTGPAAAGFAPTLAVVGVNPATVLTVAAAISIVGVDIRGLSLWQSCGLAAAIFAGGAMLWCLLTVVFAYLGRHGDTVIMFRVRRGLAGLLLTLGIVNLVASLAVRP